MSNPSDTRPAGTPRPPSEETTDFGYARVPVAEKAARVAEVFRSVAPRYDLMNDLMSLGTHRLMKRMTVELSGVREGQRVLDLAGGTGDLARLFSPRVGARGRVVLADINPAMVEIGRDRMLDAGLTNVVPAIVDAEALPFADRSFDCVTIAFGLRNVTRKDRALEEMLRVLVPGGRLVVLEFSRPRAPLLSRAYDTFSGLWPAMGRLVAGDEDSYRYLNESIRMHAPQEELAAMMEAAGFEAVRFHDLVGGIAAIHRGVRP
ncbi:MAG: class I SAM-dependent methyltransferase [Pseudomonadales bacterium]|jgi:demethylmenaquinone methyltransferase/2-methoxy-6-polyprenyl-1,4-benzoquinol methylase|nr:class I SAM-dependent methyltransferase [Pseudomonadales bacterium]